MRFVPIALAGLVLIAQMSCFHHARGNNRWLTGTCTGACDYYAMCKDLRGDAVSDQVLAACRQECDEVFSSSHSIIAFESLVCDDAIAFVEGESGREPGQPLTSSRAER